MACDQWWFMRGSVTLKGLLILQILFTLGLQTSTAKKDSSYYGYDLLSRTHSLVDDRSQISFVSVENKHNRFERSPPEPIRKSVEKPNQPTEVQDMQQQPPHLQQQLPTQQSQQPVISINTTSLANVSYSTETVTTAGPTVSEPSTKKYKPDVNKSKKNYTVVPTSTTDISALHMSKPNGFVWANQTRWPNITQDARNANESSETEIGEIPVSPSDVTNTTLKQNNITKTNCDNHQYYNSSFMIDKAAWEKYWVNMSKHPDLQINELLSSQSDRRAATVKLKFDFPCYGHKTRNITIFTGGFLHTEEYLHSWPATTQYIEPLMANFDLSNNSFVKYADNSTSFTVEWENVVLHDKPEDGAFTFQATLHQNGDIVFVYTAIPFFMENIKDTRHPVKVGLGDAYVMNRTVFFVRRKTIYEHYRVNFNPQDIQNYTVIYLTPLPTCLVSVKNKHNRFERSPPEPIRKSVEKPNQPTEVQDMQQQPPHLQQQLPTQQSQQPVISINTTSSANVSYSTETVTTVGPTVSEPSTKKYKPDVNKSKKNYTVVPTSTTDISALHMSKPNGFVWANQTRWPNITQDARNANESSETEIGEIPVSLSDVTNTTLKQNNITKTEYDTHQYYNSSFMIDKTAWEKYWVNMSKHPDLQINELLSQSHRRAATVKLKFDFPFYGHKVRNITIATGGFLYTGEYVHSWLAATQYIAPLMANFDLRLSNNSFVKYADNSTSFTVEWENVVLHDKPEDGAFTFQATLHQNGDIVFVYTAIPLVVENIKDTLHPVKVGLSDAYIMDRTVFFVRRKTIYEYHRVNFNRQDIQNYTVIYLTALPTCLEMDNCNDCVTKLTDFDCKWCPELQQCSTGVSRSKQDWLLKGCDKKNIIEIDSCPLKVTSYKDHVDPRGHEGHITRDEELSASVEPSQHSEPAAGPLEHARDKMNMGVSGIIGILVVISLIAGLAGWAAYAYRNPHSASGQMLIRYRPSQWSWRRGEARYTAATIHM